MMVPPSLKRHAVVALIGLLVGALIWLLAERLYAKAEAEGVSVSGCEESLGMDPLECV